MISAAQKITTRVQKTRSLLCVGLDSDSAMIPAHLQKNPTPQFTFNKAIIDATHQYVCAYKPNLAFYEARGEQGIRELKMTMEYLQSEHPEIFTIADAKRADIGSTNQGYVKSIFDWFGFDAVTLHPYLGREALQPFLERDDKVSIILCKTSNPGSGEFQDLPINGVPLYLYMALHVSKEWNTRVNCMLVVGATYPEEMRKIRSLTGDMKFLVPGVGAQGGSVAEVLAKGQNKTGDGVIINSSRGIIFASKGKDFAEKARGAAKSIFEEIQASQTIVSSHLHPAKK